MGKFLSENPKQRSMEILGYLTLVLVFIIGMIIGKLL